MNATLRRQFPTPEHRSLLATSQPPIDIYRRLWPRLPGSSRASCRPDFAGFDWPLMPRSRRRALVLKQLFLCHFSPPFTSKLLACTQ
ncbi:hypothetical protein HNY73_021664 [Argiope bruennichi]|uniref:Uncharacterized protein n=1 Tax=Argiope bruennichi TaxID=94029 RepID=A0A8T0E1Y4_ARGBR|nr:hypothetical protein HNY73_021664 [Argiope bruennichi]